MPLCPCQASLHYTTGEQEQDAGTFTSQEGTGHCDPVSRQGHLHLVLFLLPTAGAGLLYSLRVRHSNMAQRSSLSLQSNPRGLFSSSSHSRNPTLPREFLGTIQATRGSLQPSCSSTTDQAEGTHSSSSCSSNTVLLFLKTGWI